MTTYIALLRSVNVGGTSKLAMSDLRMVCQQAGFQNVRTYIASGNALFSSPLCEQEIKAILETGLCAHLGRPISVMIRNAAEMSTILAVNPFPHAPGDQVVALFQDTPATPDLLDGVTGQTQEERISLGLREIYVWYGQGQGKSKLRLPAAKGATARNMNTIAKLVKIAAETSA